MLEIEGCGDCKFYVQHFGIDKELEIFKIHCGHCLKKHRILKRCQRYEKGDNQYLRDNVVNFSSFNKKFCDKLNLLIKKYEELERQIFSKKN